MSIKHSKFKEVRTLVEHNMPVLLVGERGSGKTTLVQQIAESLDLPFYSVALTRQTTLSLLMGFMNVNGIYIPSALRKAVEEGGLFLLDEMDAADPNVLLSLNSLENGYLAFPDGIVEVHSDFRIMATANPFDQHAVYTGRAKLDAATLDRFDIIEIPRDTKLEKSLVSPWVLKLVGVLREALKDSGASKTITMRDSIRIDKRKKLNLMKGYIEGLVQQNEFAIEAYKKFLKNAPDFSTLSSCKNIGELFEFAAKNAEE